MSAVKYRKPTRRFFVSEAPNLTIFVLFSAFRGQGGGGDGEDYGDGDESQKVGRSWISLGATRCGRIRGQIRGRSCASIDHRKGRERDDGESQRNTKKMRKALLL